MTFRFTGTAAAGAGTADFPFTSRTITNATLATTNSSRTAVSNRFPTLRSPQQQGEGSVSGADGFGEAHFSPQQPPAGRKNCAAASELSTRPTLTTLPSTASAGVIMIPAPVIALISVTFSS